MTYLLTAGILIFGLCTYCFWRYRRTIRYTMTNWQQEAPTHFASVYERYIDSLFASVSGQQHTFTANGLRRPLDEHFLREVESTWVDFSGVKFNQDFRTRIAMCATQQALEQTSQDGPAPCLQTIRKCVIVFVLKKLQPEKKRYVIKRVLRNFFRGRVLNPLTAIVDSCAREEAFRRWCSVEQLQAA